MSITTRSAQQQLRSQTIDALEDRAEYLQNAGDYTGREYYTRWQINLDPLRESTHRRLMQGLPCQKAAGESRNISAAGALFMEAATRVRLDFVRLAVSIAIG